MAVYRGNDFWNSTQVATNTDTAMQQQTPPAAPAGTPRSVGSSQERAASYEKIRQWIRDNFEKEEGSGLPREQVYNFYKDFGPSDDFTVINPASFGKCVRHVFPSAEVKIRRLGTRGRSKYHYYGLTVKKSSPFFEDMVRMKEQEMNLAFGQSLRPEDEPEDYSPTMGDGLSESDFGGPGVAVGGQRSMQDAVFAATSPRDLPSHAMLTAADQQSRNAHAACAAGTSFNWPVYPGAALQAAHTPSPRVASMSPSASTPGLSPNALGTSAPLSRGVKRQHESSLAETHYATWPHRASLPRPTFQDSFSSTPSLPGQHRDSLNQMQHGQTSFSCATSIPTATSAWQSPLIAPGLLSPGQAHQQHHAMSSSGTAPSYQLDMDNEHDVKPTLMQLAADYATSPIVNRSATATQHQPATHHLTSMHSSQPYLRSEGSSTGHFFTTPLSVASTAVTVPAPSGNVSQLQRQQQQQQQQ
eukprot:scpid67938/ scgid5047/ Transcription factor RFX3; Regulatory factor X 3